MTTGNEKMAALLDMLRGAVIKQVTLTLGVPPRVEFLLEDRNESKEIKLTMTATAVMGLSGNVVIANGVFNFSWEIKP